MYKPNFCAECGGRIARTRWRVWTSRRFCDGCDRRFRRGRVTRPLVACVALLGAGFIGGRAMRHAPPPLVIERSAVNPPALASELSTAGTKTGATNETKEARVPSYGADGTETERPTDPAEIVSICGARTQRGTPCSRRVRGAGRCWQHRGRAAMLPPSKLIVPE
ncbi:MAG TPA: hypothetical protein VGB05_03855 [Pyrinomonadaceae bacterium]|jgi:hypothetical protein